MPNLIFVLIGFLGGIFSGAFGIGGGTIMVPLLVLFFGLTQHQAQGTVLAMLLAPVGILGVMRYYQTGNVKVNIAIMMGVGFLVGALLGAHFIQGMPEGNLKKVFGGVLVILGLRMALGR